MNTACHNKNCTNKERGNVLFLILIAVALFAALSYAASQSMNTGGKAAGEESGKVNSTPLHHHMAAVRTGITQIIIDGQDIRHTEFNPPRELDNCSAGYRLCVFHPQGGNVVYVESPANIMATGAPGIWTFNGENEVSLLGVSTAGDGSSPDTADLIAFLPGISKTICEHVNKSMHINLIPVESGIFYQSAYDMVNPDGNTLPNINGSGATIGPPNGTNVDVLDGQIYGCFEQDGQYIYYHTLIER